jgi:hypothetical protein
MSKTRRIEVRLTDEDHALLCERAQGFGGSITKTVESFLHALRPVSVIGIRSVGNRGRVRFSVRFSNQMVVHGFLWSRGGQLLGPRIWAGNHWSPIVSGPPGFWTAVRHLCEERFSETAQPEQEIDEYEEVR